MRIYSTIRSLEFDIQGNILQVLRCNPSDSDSVFSYKAVSVSQRAHGEHRDEALILILNFRDSCCREMYNLLALCKLAFKDTYRAQTVHIAIKSLISLVLWRNPNVELINILCILASWQEHAVSFFIGLVLPLTAGPLVQARSSAYRRNQG